MPEPHRLIAFDIDETIVGPDLKIPLSLLSVVSDMRSRGTKFTLATGRMLRSTRVFAEKLNIDNEIICYQGAVTAMPSGQIVRQRTLENDVVLDVLEVLQSTRAQILSFMDDRIYSTTTTAWSVGYGQRMGVAVELVSDVSELYKSPPNLLLAVDEPEQTRTLAAELGAQFENRAMITHSRPQFCEVGPVGAGKEVALSQLAADMGINRADVIAFGDGPGDAEMLKWAGVGVAVSAGHPDALTVADVIIDGAPGVGVAEFLRELD
ncbi:MAG: HAD family hydrolase [Chloroflexi bacterium]|nr:HAD family hydrolase [Chloroflexota bacterium]